MKWITRGTPILGNPHLCFELWTISVFGYHFPGGMMITKKLRKPPDCSDWLQRKKKKKTFCEWNSHLLLLHPPIVLVITLRQNYSLRRSGMASSETNDRLSRSPLYTMAATANDTQFVKSWSRRAAYACGSVPPWNPLMTMKIDESCGCSSPKNKCVCLSVLDYPFISLFQLSSEIQGLHSYIYIYSHISHMVSTIPVQSRVPHGAWDVTRWAGLDVSCDCQVERLLGSWSTLSPSQTVHQPFHGERFLPWALPLQKDCSWTKWLV